MAVCLKARLVQSDLRAARNLTRSGRLVLGQGRAQGRATLCQGRWRTRSRTRTHKDAQGGAQGHGPASAHKVKKAKPRTRLDKNCPRTETHKVRTRSARIWFRNKDLGKLPYVFFPSKGWSPNIWSGGSSSI